MMILGKKLIKKWNDILEIEEIFIKLKNKYEVLYKKYTIDASSKNNQKLLFIITAMLVVNVIGVALMIFK